MDINEKRAKAAEYVRKWREKNRESDREYHRSYYESHKKQMLESIRKYEKKLSLSEEGREKLRKIRRNNYSRHRDAILEKARLKRAEFRKTTPPKKVGRKPLSPEMREQRKKDISEQARVRYLIKKQLRLQG
jgi:hypothetical protein